MGKGRRYTGIINIPPLYPRSEGVSVDISIKLDINEVTRHLKADQVKAVMNGIAKVIAAASPKEGV